MSFIADFNNRRTGRMLAIQLVERINDEKSTIEEILNDCPPPGWMTTIQEAKAEIKLVSSILTTYGPYFPYNSNVFRAFDLCPLSMLKVVILAQDPYHSTDSGRPQANGLAFSTDKGRPVQPSLNNIYTELTKEFPEDTPHHKKFVRPNHGDLTKWAEQGVLLLNTCLTVKPHQPASHGGIWNGFMTRVVDSINRTKPDVIVMAFGDKAIKFAQNFSQRVTKLYATHPSPYSAYRASRDVPAFMGCGLFKQANQELIQKGQTPIDWTLD